MRLTRGPARDLATMGDENKPKPYGRTYRGGGRRRSLDDELAGLRPPRDGEAPRPAPERRSAQRRVTPAERRASDADRRAEAERRSGAGDRRVYGTDRRSVDGGPRSDAGDEFSWGAAGTAAPPYVRYEAGGAAAPVEPRGATRPARRRFRWWYVPVGLLTLLVVAGVVATVLAYPSYKRFDRAVHRSNHRLGTAARAALTPDDGMILRTPTTVLLLGTDSVDGEPARSDTIMLMRFDPDTHSINELSIPRDTRVDVPGRGTMKINEAMFWGGPALAIKTVSSYLGIPINHVVVVNFRGFWRVVDVVGGVDLYVPETVSTTPGPDGEVVTFKKGWHHFDARAANQYVRIRYFDNDFKRAQRQQLFVRAIQKKIAQPSMITQLPTIGRRMMSGIDTDLTTNELLELGWVKWRADDTKGKRWVLAGEPAYVGGIAYVLPPSDAKKRYVLERFLGG